MFSFEANQSLGDSGTYVLRHYYLALFIALAPWILFATTDLSASVGRKNMYAVEEYVHWLAIKCTMLCHPIPSLRRS